MSAVDPVELTAKLVRCASVTPANDGALEILEELLSMNTVFASRAEAVELLARL